MSEFRAGRAPTPAGLTQSCARQPLERQTRYGPLEQSTSSVKIKADCTAGTGCESGVGCGVVSADEALPLARGSQARNLRCPGRGGDPRRPGLNWETDAGASDDSGIAMVVTERGPTVFPTVCHASAWAFTASQESMSNPRALGGWAPNPSFSLLGDWRKVRP